MTRGASRVVLSTLAKQRAQCVVQACAAQPSPCRVATAGMGRHPTRCPATPDGLVVPRWCPRRLL